MDRNDCLFRERVQLHPGKMNEARIELSLTMIVKPSLRQRRRKLLSHRKNPRKASQRRSSARKSKPIVRKNLVNDSQSPSNLSISRMIARSSESRNPSECAFTEHATNVKPLLEEARCARIVDTQDARAVRDSH